MGFLALGGTDDRDKILRFFLILSGLHEAHVPVGTVVVPQPAFVFLMLAALLSYFCLTMPYVCVPSNTVDTIDRSTANWPSQ